MTFSEIKIGDYVLSFNEVTHQNEYQKVIHLISHENDYELVNIEVEGGESFVSTLEHPFYIDNEWKNASELLTSDRLTLVDDVLAISRLSRTTQTLPVYNFTVANTHTYYVGETGILVHNARDNCVISVNNMDDFFGSTAFGSLVKNSSSRTSRQIQGQSVYRVTKESGTLKRGYHYYLDNRHKDHFEVFDRRGKFKYVLNLDGTINQAKSAAAKGRSIDL